MCVRTSAFCRVSDFISCEDSDYVWLILLFRLPALIALSTNVVNKTIRVIW